ncbi:MAG: hypothetical protein Q4G22_14225 [Paracoccus sp. (in: a-proteobacteria)]|uniref:hypothetical protein n=1 Tax=Paracoccus sp. TaxID=267 RepID=UPI0026DED992|nr:hypothetical protein [Paracoccus sp. (in: a-proteobacteria)]MDO5632971.1 hypothetical protein [Paracoccus sp. (in: a-proteobacteria)]
MAAIKSMMLAVALACGLGAAHAGEAGDAVFAERGPWALGDRVLTWRMVVDGPPAQGFQPISDGRLDLAQVVGPSGGQPMLQVTVQDGARDRLIGPFPVSAGDPVLMWFLEQTARDMSALTGGSPFYIKNRVKDALFRGGSLNRDGGRAVAVFRPFADDSNAARMAGFQTLTLTFEMDGETTNPIRRMTAVTEAVGAAPAYRSELVLK